MLAGCGPRVGWVWGGERNPTCSSGLSPPSAALRSPGHEAKDKLLWAAFQRLAEHCGQGSLQVPSSLCRVRGMASWSLCLLAPSFLHTHTHTPPSTQGPSRSYFSCFPLSPVQYIGPSIQLFVAFRETLQGRERSTGWRWIPFPPTGIRPSLWPARVPGQPLVGQARRRASCTPCFLPGNTPANPDVLRALSPDHIRALSRPSPPAEGPLAGGASEFPELD